MRGEEILSGAQRVHNAPLLEKRMKEVGINPSDMQEYLDSFRWAAPPHAGAGLGKPWLCHYSGEDFADKITLISNQVSSVSSCSSSACQILDGHQCSLETQGLSGQAHRCCH
jgi:hypothetical protein